MPCACLHLLFLCFKHSHVTKTSWGDNSWTWNFSESNELGTLYSTKCFYWVNVQKWEMHEDRIVLTHIHSHAPVYLRMYRLQYNLQNICAVMRKVWKDDTDCVKKCMEYEVEDARPRGRPKKTWREIVSKDCRARGLNTEDAMCRSWWRKQIEMIDDHDECEWVNVSSGTGSPGFSWTNSTEQ